MKKYNIDKDNVRILYRGKEMTDWESPIAQINLQNLDKLLFVYDEKSNFRLSNSLCGENIILAKNGLTANVDSHDKWYVVLGDTAITSGKHSWTIHMDRCAGGYIFIGLAEHETQLTMWLGGDRHGWGLLGDGSRWVRGIRSGEFGPGFRTGDTMRMSIDMDARSLSVAKNEQPLGVAFTDLPDKVYPAIALYSAGDQVTLGGFKRGRWSHTSRNDSSIYLRSIKGNVVTIDPTHSSTKPFGYYPGDRVYHMQKKQEGTVTGVGIAPARLKGLLFVHFVERKGVSGYDTAGMNQFRLVRRANLRRTLKNRLREVVQDANCKVTIYDR